MTRSPTSSASALRVPGVSVRAVEPGRRPGLPRLDVAAFVGFAERGPVDEPVALSEVADYERRFGRDVELDDGRISLRPLLARTVNSFFENGGRRCWVVRVSGSEAARATFGVPGLYRADRRRSGGRRRTRGMMRASSPGAWANDFCAAVRLVSVARSLEGVDWVGDDPSAAPGLDRLAGEGAFRVTGPDRWTAGDLLRIRDARGVEWIFAVDAVEEEFAGPRGRPVDAVARGRFVAEATRFHRALASPPLHSPPLASPPPPGRYAGSPRRVEALTFDLHVDGPGDRGERLPGLGFHPAHRRYLLRVLEEESRFLAPLRPEGGGGTGEPPLYYPFRMPGRTPPRLPVGPLTEGRDDLGAGAAAPEGRAITPELFAPPEMDRLGQRGLLELAARAQEERHRSAVGPYGAEPIRLRGLLAVLPVDEVTLVAVPDALRLVPEAEPPAETEPPEPDPESEPTEEPPPAGFRPCPDERADEEGEETGEAGAGVPAGPARPAPGPRSPPGGFSRDGAVEIQRAALRLCRLRGDMVAVLAAPESERPVRWRERLLRPGADASHACLYHPWIRVAGDEGRRRTVETVPPDGAACGVVARRERARGAWIAPANEPVRGCLGLSEEPDADAWAVMLKAGVNLIRRHPDTFRVMSARTLSSDRHLSELNVRRLLILLKKALVAWGMDFVFESHDALLRSSLKQRIETALEWLFRHGAFAGRVPEEAYRVVVDESVNPSAGVEAGRLVALVKVAPSWPMEFLEVRLIRTGEGLLRLEEA